ncbi:DUF4256 domain-containing protein [Patescibacteria group bacterium]
MNTIEDELDLKFEEHPERKLSPEQVEQLLSTLEARFNANKKRHKGIEWSQVKARLNEASLGKLWSLNEMEGTGGEPDVAAYIEETGEYEFWDFSEESPSGRRWLCCDLEGQADAELQGCSPKGNAVDMAAAMGLGGVLDLYRYDKLKELGKFDIQSWSWVKVPIVGTFKGLNFLAHSDGYSVRPSFLHNSFGGFRGWLRV